MLGIGIAGLILAGVQILQAWRQHRQAQAIKALQNCDNARMAMSILPSRILPDAAKLLNDLDADALAAKPLIDNATAIAVALNAVCQRLESIVTNPRFAPTLPGEWKETADGRKAFVPTLVQGE